MANAKGDTMVMEYPVYATEVWHMRRTRLFCLPYAGGSSIFYRRLKDYLKPDVELCAIDLKGHGRRMGEVPNTRAEDVLDDVWEQMAGFGLDEPFALLGYSLGSTIAYHEYFRLREAGLRPRHLFFMANTAPYVPDVGIPSPDQPDDVFLEGMTALGGISRELLECQELIDIFLPIMRADVCVEEELSMSRPKAIDCDMSIIYSSADDASCQIDAWRACAGGRCDFSRFEGSHFFMLDHYAEVARIINRAL